MDVDEIVALGIFLVFFLWSVFYFSIFIRENIKAEMISGNVGFISENIMDKLGVDVFEVNISFTSGTERENAVFYVERFWSQENKNSTIVYFNGNKTDCMYSNDRLYFLGNTSVGVNNVSIRFYNLEEPLKCNSSFEIENETLLVLGVIKSKRMLSREKIEKLKDMDYRELKNLLKIAYNFRIEINSPGINETLGKKLPGTSNIYKRELKERFLETGEMARVGIFMWA